MNESTLEEIWSARAEIAAQCHRNVQELIAYYQERQKVHSARLVQPEKREYRQKTSHESSMIDELHF